MRVDWQGNIFLQSLRAFRLSELWNPIEKSGRAGRGSGVSLVSRGSLGGPLALWVSLRGPWEVVAGHPGFPLGVPGVSLGVAGRVPWRPRGLVWEGLGRIEHA